jgi:hypothetical protein
MISVPFGQTSFPTKRDTWIVALIWGGALLLIVGGVAQLSSAAPPVVRSIGFLVLLAAAGFMLWVLYGTQYRFLEDCLLITSGPFRFRVPLSEIDSVKPSRNPLSSPACSLDRLLIEWGGGRRRIMISPEPRQAFLQALDERCPQLILDGDRLLRLPGQS